MTVGVMSQHAKGASMSNGSSLVKEAASNLLLGISRFFYNAWFCLNLGSLVAFKTEDCFKV